MGPLAKLASVVVRLAAGSPAANALLLTLGAGWLAWGARAAGGA